MRPSLLASRARLVRAAVACAVLLALIGYVTAHLLTGGGGPPRCTVRADGEKVSLDPEQAVNAATIEAVASSRALPERAVTIALATALQESGLRNLRRGDRDSLGLFQQRPSQGWGTARQVRDPVHAAGRFYADLVKVPGYSRLPLTVAAQRVQRSGYPQAYAKHEAEAAVLTGALVGRDPAALTCPGPVDDGVRGDPARVRARLRHEFGPAVPAAAPARAPADQVVLPVAAPARGWELAHWAVAHARELRIARVAYGGRVWRGQDADKGWRAARSAAPGVAAAAGSGGGAVTIETAH
ncbi:hypothetical protein RKE29_14265 [Streptomyces sp. B1866]|uniref:hypothetical protein n=1 Tax=Streptomyces sp. B1866 TaxID=3075431 RepID=UPI002890B0D8|nr:hypothetical protein [Streptomyces sp. B1866]MDT3397793.1 hypothetical protein [Streptomyces sp. B1866]